MGSVRSGEIKRREAETGGATATMQEREGREVSSRPGTASPHKRSSSGGSPDSQKNGVPSRAKRINGRSITIAPEGRLADHLSPLQTGSPPPDEDGDGRENLLTRVFPAVFSWAASTYNQPFLQMEKVEKSQTESSRGEHSNASKAPKSGGGC